MSKIYKLLAVLVLALIAMTVSCSKDNDGGGASLRDYNEQYQKDIDTINEFLDEYKMEVSADFDVTFTKITAQNPGTSIRNQTEYPLQWKYVEVEDHNLTTGDAGHETSYKVYYINLREGSNLAPTPVDSVYVSYKGVLINNNVFDQAQNPIWFTLNTTIKGWQEIVPLFKTGFYASDGGPDPVTFTDFGAGIVFVPSGLGYYGQTRANIPGYSPLIFNFKLFELNYIDHDRDGILSKDETDTYNDDVENGDDILKCDTDGDGIVNSLDIDDDGDHIRTKDEIHFDGSGNLIFEDCDSDGVPNYLDDDGDNDGIPDYNDPTGACI